MTVPNLNGSPDFSALPTWAQDHVSGYTLVGDVYHVRIDPNVMMERTRFDMVVAGIETGSEKLKQRVPASELSDAQMAELLGLSDAWEDIAEGATIPEDKLLTYQADALYRVIDEHDKQLTWTPASAHSLFAFETIPGVVDEWTQPDSTNPYLMHAVVTRNGTVYLSLHEDNVWDPEAVGEDIWMTLGPESDIDQILADLDDTIANL